MSKSTKDINEGDIVKMKRNRMIYKICIVILAVFTISACTNVEQKEFAADSILESLLKDISYDEELVDVSKNAKYYFEDLPDNTEINMYSSFGKSSDKIIIFHVKDKNNIGDVEKSVNNYMKDLTKEAQNYNPEEVDKINKAVIVSNDKYFIVCITDDTETVKKIIG